MSSLLYKEDADAARDRLAAWWRGADIGRPAMALFAPRDPPAERVPARPAPAGWQTDYSMSDFDFRVYLARRACVDRWYLGEAFPYVAPDLGPGCLGLYLGCRGVDMPGTVWFEPCLREPEAARFEFDPDNACWQFTLRLARAQLALGRGKFLVQFPDLIEGLDTLAALRGTEALLTDLVERPDWVRRCLERITDVYFRYFDPLYTLLKDERGGSHFWLWAPGRLAKLQCDFSAMISPAMFGEFMVPALRAMTARLDYSLYHWDGPGAIPHHDHLLALPRLDAIQWTPGAGAEPLHSRRWWPLYHKTVEAGKKVLLLGFEDTEQLKVFRREFGPRFKQFFFMLSVPTRAAGDKVLALASD
jgi:5-methyltetrahydrofolate--homocysteine methyltransferase